MQKFMWNLNIFNLLSIPVSYYLTADGNSPSVEVAGTLTCFNAGPLV